VHTAVHPEADDPLKANRYRHLVRGRDVMVDAVVAGAAFAVSAAVLASAEPSPDLRDADPMGYVLLGLYSASPVLRRRAPVVAVVAGLLAGVAYAAAGYQPALTPVVLLSVYTAGSVLPHRQGVALLMGATAVATLVATFSPGPTDLGVPTAVVAAWLLGRHLGSRRAYTRELEQQNRLLEQARLDLADRAVNEERLRIARELHDVVAHTLSVVALHAGTGRMVAGDDPAAARDALATIETSTRTALVEMRRLLGVLRSGNGAQTDGPDLAPAPGLRDLDALVADVVRSGVAVEVRVEGERHAVPPGVDLSAYRIVQEALTNVIKHAPGARAAVVVRYEPHAVHVEVADDGPGRAPGSAGHGVIGMRERVTMHGGRLSVGPGAAGGFRVAATLPIGGGV
jgi:signal transduction histidine kinase